MPPEIHDSILNSSSIQYGFAGFCLILVGLLAWVIAKVFALNAATQAIVREVVQVVQKNTDTLERVLTAQNEMTALQRRLTEKLLARPCIASSKVD